MVVDCCGPEGRAKDLTFRTEDQGHQQEASVDGSICLQAGMVMCGRGGGLALSHTVGGSVT